MCLNRRDFFGMLFDKAYSVQGVAFFFVPLHA